MIGMSKKYFLSMKNQKFDLFCHKHKHTTKIIGYPIQCEKCMDEDMKEYFK